MTSPKSVNSSADASSDITLLRDLHDSCGIRSIADSSSEQLPDIGILPALFCLLRQSCLVRDEGNIVFSI